MFSDFFNKFYDWFDGLPFDALIYFIWGSYLAVFLVAFVATLCSTKFKAASKKPFLCLTNAYAAISLAAFMLQCGLAQSITATVAFWVVGYVLYGSLCAFNKQHLRKEKATTSAAVATPVPVQPMRAMRGDAPAPIPAAKNGVRLEHAVAVTDKLLTKNLAKTDRQELEKLKNTLAVLKIKGTLNPTEADILNDNFNALLKLMAKYNV
ncbi:MAG: hypothetical protein K2O89_00390 [Clostridia bacterium]|nr:hypothetical protein [Clostridia bacterium]